MLKRDNPAMIHLLASTAGFVIVCALTVKAINTALDFAVVLGALSSLILLCSAVYYLLLVFGWQPTDAPQDALEEEDAPVITREEEVTPRTPQGKRVINLSDEGFDYFTRLRWFILRVLEVGLTDAQKELSRVEWEKKYAPMLDSAGLTMNNGTRPRTWLPETEDHAFTLLDAYEGFDIRASLAASVPVRSGSKEFV